VEQNAEAVASYKIYFQFDFFFCSHYKHNNDNISFAHAQRRNQSTSSG